MSLRIPASAEGIAHAWSLMRCGVQTPEVQWCAPLVNPMPQGHMHLIMRGLSPLQKSRLRRVMLAEHDLSAAEELRSFHAAARACRIDLAFGLLCQLVLRDEMEPSLLRRGVLLARFELEQLDRGMIEQECWRFAMIDLRELPAMLVPLLVRELRRLGIEQEIGLLSGGHAFSPSCWKWVFPEADCNPSSIVRPRLTLGQIFQPASARQGHEGQHSARQQL